MIQKSSACELGRGEQGLGLKIVIVRGLSWCFWANRQQSSGPGTGAGQGGGCCSENLAVQTPERAELHFREKKKNLGGGRNLGVPNAARLGAQPPQGELLCFNGCCPFPFGFCWRKRNCSENCCPVCHFLQDQIHL